MASIDKPIELKTKAEHVIDCFVVIKLGSQEFEMLEIVSIMFDCLKFLKVECKRYWCWWV